MSTIFRVIILKNVIVVSFFVKQEKVRYCQQEKGVTMKLTEKREKRQNKRREWIL
jgi:hypothetical protein